MKRCGLTSTAASVSAEKRRARGREDFQMAAAMTIARQGTQEVQDECGFGQGISSDQKQRRECIWMGKGLVRWNRARVICAHRVEVGARQWFRNRDS